jgi:hypothetical protein
LGTALGFTNLSLLSGIVSTGQRFGSHVFIAGVRISSALGLYEFTCRQSRTVSTIQYRSLLLLMDKSREDGEILPANIGDQHRSEVHKSPFRD